MEAVQFVDVAAGRLNNLGVSTRGATPTVAAPRVSGSDAAATVESTGSARQ